MTEVGREYQGTIPPILGKYRDEVEKALGEHLRLDNPGLYTMLRYHLGWVDEKGRPIPSDQGKGLRPSLCIFACEAVGGQPKHALPAAVAVELVHNFSLIHDDIQDGDRERRHRPTVWAIWGKSEALQGGNAMRVLADMALQQLPRDRLAPAAVALCSQTLTEAYLEMIEGQYLDLDFEGRVDIDTPTYLNMISRKTGALMRCSMEMGALAGKGDAEAVQAMAKCGQHLGSAFQIRDDYLGIWGREEETGKAAGNDIRRRKSSLPLVYVLERAGPEEKEQLKSIYAKERVEDGDVAPIMALLEELGAQEYVERLAREQATLAQEALEGVELVPGAREELHELVEFLLTRQH